jgi:antitoxin component YwqK of YwqJK toxin-antitoxin module
MEKILLILLSSFLIQTSYSQQQTQINGINNENVYIETKIDSSDNKISSVLSFDFDLGTSYYIDFNTNGTIMSKGGFDIESFDLQVKYDDQIDIIGLPIDGTIGTYIHNFPAKKTGFWTYYYSNGEIQMKGTYLNNLREGEWLFYSENNQLAMKRNYHQGKINREEIIISGSLTSYLR